MKIKVGEQNYKKGWKEWIGEKVKKEENKRVVGRCARRDENKWERSDKIESGSSEILNDRMRGGDKER